VATAIATSPRVVVADEPTFGQDSRTWAELVELLADLQDAGCNCCSSPTTRRWSRPWPTAPWR
jgi:energy-coupling factor transporter ATP-binding protein EcfA2